MDFSIRPAVPGDAGGIAELHGLIWPREAPEPQRIKRLLDEKGHSAHVASDPIGIIGYADGFTTRSGSRYARWELDLLAVHPRARRRGVGTGLLSEQMEAARSAGAEQIRALVRLNNRAGHRLFLRAGFNPDPAVYHLYTASLAEDDDPAVPDPCRLIEVSTFTYDGFWLEDCPDSARIIKVLGAHAAQGDRLIGVLVDPHKITPEDSEKMVALDFRGAFQWYQLTV